MPSRRAILITVLGPIVAVAWPAEAPAHHEPCSWGAGAAVDPWAPQAVSPTLEAPRWGCPGPRVGLTAETGEATADVGVDGSGVRWEDGSDHGTTAGGDGAHDTRRQHARLRLRVTPRRVRAGEPTRFRFRAMWIVRDFERRPGSGVAIRFRGRRVTTDGAGLAAVLARVRRPGTARAIALHEGRRAARASVRVVAAGRR